MRAIYVNIKVRDIQPDVTDNLFNVTIIMNMYEQIL